MYILCLQGKEEEGAYAIANRHGNRVLLMFDEEDDAIRYAGLLEADDFPPLVPIEIDSESMIEMCENTGYEYLIVKADELIIPPSHNEI